MHEVRLLSYAKVNLTLDVSRLRPDGYHDIDSVAQVIDISDELVVSRADAGEIEIDVVSGEAPAGGENIVHKACAIFLRKCGVRGGARFALSKRIPAQAGLGGGSGNAAAAIAALNRLYECRLSVADMAEMAGQVGSDAALFIHGGAVRMKGRGERIEPLPDGPEMHLVVVKPDVGVSTPWAYAELDKCAGRVPGVASERMRRAVIAGDRGEVVGSLANDFDSVVSDLLPEIRDAKRGLADAGAHAVLLAGSGSAVFGVFDGMEAARAGAALLAGEYEQVFACRTLTRMESTLE